MFLRSTDWLLFSKITYMFLEKIYVVYSDILKTIRNVFEIDVHFYFIVKLVSVQQMWYTIFMLSII
jgi:hypothetical protein